jgi:large subunit ribosomal protein L4
MQLEVLNINGNATGKKVDLPEGIFGIEPNDHVLYLAVKQYLANQRQGTHKSKERWELSGSTRKLHKQKGTGGSRKGDINSPLFHGGARVFGPRPRDYSFKLNKKVKVLARKSALSSKFTEGSIVIVEDFTFDAPKTKGFIKILDSLKVSGQRSLVVLPDADKNVYLSARNVPRTMVVRAEDLNTYQIVKSGSVLLSESSINKIKETLQAQ